MPVDQQPALDNWPTDMVVLVPVYNHAAMVGDVVRSALALGAPVLVVDDGSTDDSGAVAEKAGADLITLAKNCGKAEALRVGMTEAEKRGYRRVLTCDADGQHPPSEVARLAVAAGADQRTLYIGRRDMVGAPIVSRIGRFWSNTFCWVVCGARPGDSQSGLRIYPVPATNRLDVPANRYAFEIEVLVRAKWAGIALKPIDVDVLYPEDRVTHFNKLRDNYQATMVFIRLFLRKLLPVRHKRIDLASGEVIS